jgi:hypothetical protein
MLSRYLRILYTVAYLLKARTGEPEKHKLLGNGCVIRNNGVAVGAMLSVRSVPRLHNVNQQPSRDTPVWRRGRIPPP